MPKGAVFERSRRELSLDVSAGVHILLVVEQSSPESQSINSINSLEGVPRLLIPMLAASNLKKTRSTLQLIRLHGVSASKVVGFGTKSMLYWGGERGPKLLMPILAAFISDCSVW